MDTLVITPSEVTEKTDRAKFISEDLPALIHVQQTGRKSEAEQLSKCCEQQRESEGESVRTCVFGEKTLK